MRESFWRLKEGEKGQKLRQESEQFDRYKIGTSRRRTVFFLSFLFFGQQNSELHSGLGPSLRSNYY